MTNSTRVFVWLFILATYLFAAGLFALILKPNQIIYGYVAAWAGLAGVVFFAVYFFLHFCRNKA